MAKKLSNYEIGEAKYLEERKLSDYGQKEKYEFKLMRDYPDNQVASGGNRYWTESARDLRAQSKFYFPMSKENYFGDRSIGYDKPIQSGKLNRSNNFLYSPAMMLAMAEYQVQRQYSSGREVGKQKNELNPPGSMIEICLMCGKPRPKNSFCPNCGGA